MLSIHVLPESSNVMQGPVLEGHLMCVTTDNGLAVFNFITYGGAVFIVVRD
jgi:hypothetical protein